METLKVLTCESYIKSKLFYVVKQKKNINVYAYCTISISKLELILSRRGFHETFFWVHENFRVHETHLGCTKFLDYIKIFLDLLY